MSVNTRKKLANQFVEIDKNESVINKITPKFISLNTTSFLSNKIQIELFKDVELLPYTNIYLEYVFPQLNEDIVMLANFCFYNNTENIANLYYAHFWNLQTKRLNIILPFTQSWTARIYASGYFLLNPIYVIG